MRRLELSDLVATYPPITTPGFQTIISNKKEFRELASYPTEPPPSKKGTYYNHQKLFERYMSKYDDCVVIHDTGTGKSCTISALGEHYKKNKAQIDHVYILVNGKTQKDEFKKQLACICSDGSYETAESKNSKTESSQKAAITKQIKKWYTVTTYKSFTNHIKRTYPNIEDNEALKEYYSGSIFFIDEIQNIRINAETEHTAERERGEVYTTFWRVFHLIVRSKRIIASATPMVRSVVELGPHLNLILPLDMQINNSFLPVLVNNTGIAITGVYNIDLTTATLADMMPFLQGRVSYVRGLMTGAVPRYGGSNPEGNKVDYVHTMKDGTKVPSKIILDKSYMTPFQSEAYRRASSRSSTVTDPDQDDQEPEKASGIYNDHRQAANFVFPDGSWGSTGFNRFMIADGDDYRPTEEFLEYLKVPQNLMNSSIKNYNLVSRSLNEEGKRYVYNNFVSGSGSIIAGACLEAYGFRRYNKTTSAFISNFGGVRPFCSSNSDDNKSIRDGIPNDGKTYASISSKTSNAERASIFELFNSKENMNGAYIKVLNVSPVGQFGINLSDVTKADIMSSDWNPSDVYQAVNRVFRSTSHVNLIEAYKRLLTSQGKSTDNIILPVDVNLYATYYQDERGDWRETVEPVMYKSSEYKDLYIRKMMRILKQSAFDCQIHKARNVRSTDVDYSQVCDYDICQYECSDPIPQGEIDTKTYDVYYVEEILDTLIEYITHYFNINTAGDVADITEYYKVYSSGKEVKAYYIYLALDRMIKERTLIYNSYGFASYVREDKGVFFLTRSYPRINEGSDYASNYYSGNLISISSISLTETISKIDTVKVIETSHDLNNMVIGSPEFITIINNLNTESKSQMLESAVIKKVTGVVDPVSDFIFNYFKDSVIRLNEPVTEINKSSQIISRKGIRGRKPTENTKKKLIRIESDDQEFIMDNNTEFVYIHNLYTTGGKTTKYAAITHFLKAEGRIRIYKPSEGGWRDVNIYESPVYNKVLQIIIGGKKNTLDTSYPINGIIIDGKFSIKDGRKQSANANIDKRRIRDGMACTSYKKAELIDMMYNIGMELYDIPILINRDSMIMYLNPKLVEDVRTWDDRKISFFYTWFISQLTKSELCYKIAIYMANNNMIFTGTGNAVDQVANMIKSDPTVNLDVINGVKQQTVSYNMVHYPIIQDSPSVSSQVGPSIPRQLPTYGQPNQLPTYGQPRQLPTYGQPRQLPTYGQPPNQLPTYGQPPNQPRQLPTYGQPNQLPRQPPVQPQFGQPGRLQPFGQSRQSNLPNLPPNYRR